MTDYQPGWLARSLYLGDEPQEGNLLWVNPFQANYTKDKHPYGFSEYFVWIVGGVKPMQSLSDINAVTDPGVQAMYSDRMQQSKPDAWKRALQSIREDCRMLTQHLSPHEATKFLTAYVGKPVEACALVEGCNISNGYSYFIFYWKDATP